MIKTVLDRDAMRKVSPELVDSIEADMTSGMPTPAYVLAWAVAPGGQTVPGPGEPDADAVRAWAERALVFQARGYAQNRKGGYRLPRRNFVIPDAVVDHVLALARVEHELDPRPALMPRVCAAITAGRPMPAPEPEPEYALPVPTPRF